MTKKRNIGQELLEGVRAIKRGKGKRVSVISTLQTQPPMVADELRRQADQFIEIADLETQICRDSGAARPQRETRAFPTRAPTFVTRDSGYQDDDLAEEEV